MASRLSRHKLIKNRAKKGLQAGSLVHVGARKSESVTLVAIDYGQQRVETRPAADFDCTICQPERAGVIWVNIEGLRPEIIQQIGECTGTPPLVLEDVLNTDQQPKVEIFPGHIVLVLKMLSYDSRRGQIESEQVSLIFGKNYLFSLQEGKEGDQFDPIRARLAHANSLLRAQGADFLAYSLLDAVVDNYFAVLEKVAEKIEFLDERLLDSPSHEVLQQMYGLKRELVLMRKAVWPLREALVQLQREAPPQLGELTRTHLRDVYEHVVQVIASAETFREVISGMLELHLASIGHKTNEAMKSLTMIATLFIPLSFVAGLYGMNFRHMPELEWVYGYPSVLLLMALIASAILLFFKRKRWL
jgi:magnesium transporter